MTSFRHTWEACGRKNSPDASFVSTIVPRADVLSTFGIPLALIALVGRILLFFGKIRIQKRVNLTLKVSPFVIVYVD